MMLQKRDKKNKIAYVYLFFFILVTSINNKNFNNQKLFDNKILFEVSGLSNKENQKLIKDLSFLNYKNIFKLDKKELSNKIIENNLVLNFLIKINYPNKVDIVIKKADFIGKVLKNNKLYIIGSNGKLINYQNNINSELPYFYGNFKKDEYLKFLKIIIELNLKIEDVSSFYFFPSGRWDINFNNGLKFKLPIKETKNALLRALILANDQNFINSKIIDLRIKNKIILSG